MSEVTSNYENEPSGSDTFSTADDEIRGLKTVLIALMSKEHDMTRNVDIATGKTGTLLQGSGKMYFQDSAPTVRPDGSAFDDSDCGRKWYKTAYGSPGGNELGDGRFGEYTLIKTATSTYKWLPSDGNLPIGTRLPHDESLLVWVDPTASTGWYTTGTRPGWVKCEGGNYTRPQGVLAVPDDRDKSMFGTQNGGTDGAAEGNNEVTIGKANLPPHGHVIDSDDFDVTVGDHPESDLPDGHGYGGTEFGKIADGAKRPVYGFNHGADDFYTKTPNLTHSITVENFPATTEVTDESDNPFDNDPVDITPSHRNITWVLRIY